MKILREKLFFDYKGYAEKYGEEAANRMRGSRSELANKIKSKRLDNKFVEQSYQDPIARGGTASEIAKKFVAKKKDRIREQSIDLLDRGKRELSKQEAADWQTMIRKKKLKKAAIGAAALTAAGIGYKLYKNKKKSHAKIDEEEGKKTGFNKKKVDAVVLDTKHKTDKKTGDYNGSK